MYRILINLKHLSFTNLLSVFWTFKQAIHIKYQYHPETIIYKHPYKMKNSDNQPNLKQNPQDIIHDAYVYAVFHVPRQGNKSTIHKRLKRSFNSFILYKFFYQSNTYFSKFV